jgi:O-antigen/teichoic acid export membrane protein
MRKSSIAAFAAGPPLAGAVSFANLLMISWMFSVEDIGRNGLLVTMLAMGPLLFSLGLEQAYVREYHESKDKRRLFAQCFSPGATLLVCAIGISGIQGPHLSSILYSEYSSLLFVCTAAAIALTFVNTFFSNVLRMQERGLAYSVSQLLPKVLLAVSLGFAFIASASFSFAFLAMCQLAALATATVYMGVITRGEWRGLSFNALAAPDLRSLLKFSLPLQLSNGMFWILTAMNLFALRYFTDFEQLGLYATAAGIAGLGMVVRSMFTVVWMPMVYKWHSEGGALSKVEAVLNPIGFAVCLLIAIAGLLSSVITWLLPERLWDAQYLIAACLVQPFLYAVSEVTVVGIPLMRKTHFAIFVVVGAAAVNAIGCVALIPHYGAAGAAIANALAFTVFFILRSEFSGLVWHRLRVKRSYVSVALVVVVACLQAFAKDQWRIAIHAAWAALIVALFVVYRDDAAKVYRFIHARATYA